MLRHINAYLKTKPRLFDWALMMRPATSQSDKFFDSFSKSHNRRVSFIQVGANDGLRWDPLRKYVVRDKWNGIFVEPVPTVFEMLKNNYRHVQGCEFVFVNAAIGSSNADALSFWTLSEEFLQPLSFERQMYYLRKSSFYKRHVLRAVTYYDANELRFLGVVKPPEHKLALDQILKEIRVPCMTLGQLVRQHWSKGNIDLLVIDAEGHEWEIISSMDFTVTKPEAIFFESHNLAGGGETTKQFLIDNGYSVNVMGGDCLAVRSRIS